MSESAVVNQRGEVNKTGRALTLFALLRPAFLSGASTITWTHFSAAPRWQLHLFCQLKKRRKQLDGKWKRKRRSSPSSPPLHSLRLSFFFFFSFLAWVQLTGSTPEPAECLWTWLPTRAEPLQHSAAAVIPAPSASHVEGIAVICGLGSPGRGRRVRVLMLSDVVKTRLTALLPEWGGVGVGVVEKGKGHLLSSKHRLRRTHCGWCVYTGFFSFKGAFQVFLTSLFDNFKVWSYVWGVFESMYYMNHSLRTTVLPHSINSPPFPQVVSSTFYLFLLFPHCNSLYCDVAVFCFLFFCFLSQDSH